MDTRDNDRLGGAARAEQAIGAQMSRAGIHTMAWGPIAEAPAC